MRNQPEDDAIAARLTVSEEILALMGRRRVSQTALSAAMGMSQSALSRKLRGYVPWDIDDMAAIARFFDVPVTALFGLEGAHYGDSENEPTWSPEVIHSPGQMELRLGMSEPRHPTREGRKIALVPPLPESV